MFIVYGNNLFDSYNIDHITKKKRIEFFVIDRKVHLICYNTYCLSYITLII